MAHTHTLDSTHVQSNVYVSIYEPKKENICVFAIGTVQEVRFVEKLL